MTVDGRGRTVSTEIGLAPLSRRELPGSIDSAQLHRWRLFADGSDDLISLPASRVWDIVPAFHPGRREPGARWVDTLDRTAEDGGFRQALEGVRVSTLVGDTAIGGRRHWIVRDSARVRYEERWLSEERTLDTLAVVEREATGTILGRYVYDPHLRLYRIRHDTTALEGTAVLRYPDGRTFSTPARFQQIRTMELVPPDEETTRRRTGRAAGHDHDVPLVSPRTEREKRLAAGDALLLDSLVGVWERSRDPGKRARVLHLLTWWGPSSPEFERRLLEGALAAGDTVWAVTELRGGGPAGSRPLGGDALKLLLPFLRDPGRAFAFGLRRDPFYENARQDLLTCPPAATPDTSAWPCDPEACRALAGAWSGAEEPRLRELGLIARLVMDPARWADTVLARAESGSTFLRPAASLIRGVGATWPAASDVPLPGADADWRAWLRWMQGRPAGDRSPEGPPLSVRFDPSHATAIRFREARTGRDVSGELRRKYGTATSDSARLVFGSMALALDEYDPDPSSVAERFRSGSAADRSLAAREMHHLFGERAAPADPTTSAALVDRLLAIAIAGERAWPPLRPGSERRSRKLHQIAGDRVGADSVLILEGSLPREIEERWRRRATLVEEAQLRARPDGQSTIIFVPSSVSRVGPFVRLGLDFTVRRNRPEDESPGGLAAGLTVYLVETPDGWAVVSVERRIV